MQRPLRRVFLVLIWLVALVPPVVAVGWLMYANLLNPRVVQRLTGNYDGLYWDAAQLQIAYARFENQLLMFDSKRTHDVDVVRLRYQVLQSKLNVMVGSTRTLSTMPDLQQRQENDLRDLQMLIASFDARIGQIDKEPDLAGDMVVALRRHWGEVTDLALSRRFADVTEREAIRGDFIAKRRELFAAGIVLMLLSSAAAVLLVLTGYRRTRLIQQQHALLEAEHEASRAAREASAAKDAFLGMISHELRTPLHAIVSSIELLGFNSHSENDRKVIRRLETAARQLEAQMKDLTDYARLGAGKLELRDEQFDPRELLRSIADENEGAAHARGLAFECAVSGAAGKIESDPHRIRQIANNLVINAIRYTESGSVGIEFVVSACTLSIIVRDTGPGLTSAQIPQIFKEFTQLDASRSRRYEGAGMGLAIVRGLVDLFGGTIATDSRLGEGTTFTVMLPVRPVAPAIEIDMVTHAHEKAERPRVLIVDDNRLVRESLCEMVVHMGYHALPAGDIDSALARLDAVRCDIVLLDLHMPGRDGFALVTALAQPERAHRQKPRVIAVSAYAPDQVHEVRDGRAGAGPFFDYLTKPVHYEVLRAALQRALSAPPEASAEAA